MQNESRPQADRAGQTANERSNAGQPQEKPVRQGQSAGSAESQSSDNQAPEATDNAGKLPDERPDASTLAEAETGPTAAETVPPQDPEMQLASAPANTTEVTQEGTPQNREARAGATPLEKAIQVVQRLQSPDAKAEVATRPGVSDADPPLPGQPGQKPPTAPPGLSQASQQLENNLLRWTSRQQAAVETTSAGQSATSTSSISSLITSQTQAASPAAVPRFDVPGNIQQPAWQQAVAERVVMIQHQNIQQAELKLHPAELGPVSVRLESLQDGTGKQTSIQFAATHADTREALEAALPRLREMFNQQGMNLVKADIQQQFQQPGGQQGQPTTFTPETQGGEAIAVENNEINVQRSRQNDNLLDLYV